MRRVVLTILDYMLVTIYIATVIIGLSILGAFVAFQYVDYQQSQSKNRKEQIKTKQNERKISNALYRATMGARD